VASTFEALLNLREAAKRLRVGESTLRKKIYAGLGPTAIKLPGSDRWKFRPADFDAYERSGELTPEILTSAAAAVPRAPTRRPPVRKAKR
jgi:Helix-turn-helix domain